MTKLCVWEFPEAAAFGDCLLFWAHKGPHSWTPLRNAGNDALFTSPSLPRITASALPETPENSQQGPWTGGGLLGGGRQAPRTGSFDTWAPVLPPALTHPLTLGGGEVVA